MASIGLNVASTSRGARTVAMNSKRALATGIHLRPRILASAPVPSSVPLRTFIRDSASSWSTSSSWTSSPDPNTNLSAQPYGTAQQQSPPLHPLPARIFSNSNSSSSSSSSTYPPYSKHFSTTSSLYTSHHFDTQAFAQRLEASGISREQADVLTEALRDVIDESITNLAKGLVTREEGDQTNYTQKVDFTRLKSELQLLERNDFALMKSENERLMADVEKLKQRLREEITRTTAGVRLDLNLEKGMFPACDRIKNDIKMILTFGYQNIFLSVIAQVESETSQPSMHSRSRKLTPVLSPKSLAFEPVFRAQSSTYCSILSVWQQVRVLCFWPTSECSVRPIPNLLHAACPHTFSTRITDGKFRR